MNTIFPRTSVFWLPSLAAVAVLGSGLPAVAQTVDNASSQQLTTPPATAASPSAFSVEVENASPSLDTAVNPVETSEAIALPQFPNATTQEIASRTLTPVPGTVATSSAVLTSESVQPTSQPSDNRVAQSDISVGRPTRGGRSYIGVAGNIGIDGTDSSLGDGNFAAISKIGLSNAISVRPSAVFGDNTTILIPVTYDFTLQSADAFAEPLAIAPYVGVGAAIKTGDDSKAAFLVSGGLDFPLNAQFTATAAVNAGFFEDTDIGLLIGVGYNFTGF